MAVSDAERRLEYFEREGTQRGFESIIETEHLETFAHQCVDDEQFREFVLRTNDLKPFVRSLTDVDNDDFVTECYYQLLGFHRELSEPTAAVLKDNSDERARKGLIGAFWSDHNSPAVIEALIPIADSNVVRSTGSLLARGDQEPLELRRAAIQLLEEVDCCDLLDESDKEQLAEDLQDAITKENDDTLREKLQQLLTTL